MAVKMIDNKHFTCLSTDVKPTTATSSEVELLDICTETDTGIDYITYDGLNWVVYEADPLSADQINAQVDLALNTAIPASNTALSVNDILLDIVRPAMFGMGFKVVGTGTFTTNSATVPADTLKTEVAGYWDGCWLVPGSGTEANQPRQIASFAGGVFTMMTGSTWVTAPGTVAYSIWSNGTGKNVMALGIFTTSSVSVPADTRRGEVTGYWNGCQLIPLSGAAANQPRNIALWTNTTPGAGGNGVFSLPTGALFSTAPGTVAYVIVRGTQDQVSAVDSTSALTYKSTIGNKSDAAVTTVGTTASIIAYIKGVLNQLVAFKRQAGVNQVFQKAITSAANTNGLVTIATVTTAACLIKSIVVKAVTAVQTDLTSAAVKGGASQAITFISAVTAAKANITAIDQQVGWTGAVELAAAKTIVMDVQGSGATAVNLLVTIEYEAAVDTGYLA